MNVAPTAKYRICGSRYFPPVEGNSFLYVAERTTGLNPANWSDEGVVVHEIVPDAAASRETVTIRSTTPMNQQPREFMRVDVEVAPTPPPPPAGLSILEALYGADTRFNDVKSIIEANIADNAVSMPATNSTMGGDPAPGVVKQLNVRYANGGVDRRNR